MKRRNFLTALMAAPAAMVGWKARAKEVHRFDDLGDPQKGLLNFETGHGYAVTENGVFFTTDAGKTWATR